MMQLAPPRPSRPRLAGLALGVLLLVVCQARAHWADLAVMQVDVRPEGTRVALTIPGGLIPQGDVNGDGKVSPEEVAQRTPEIARALESKLVLHAPGGPPVHFRIEGGSRPLGARVDPRVASDLPGDTHVTLKIVFDPSPTEGLRLRYDLFIADAPNATCMAQIVRGAEVTQHLFSQTDREYLVGEPIARGLHARGAAAALAQPLALLFLAALLLAAGSAAQLTEVGGSYLAGHAAGLALAGLEVVGLDAGVLQTLAVLSVVFAALENFWRTDLTGRWKIAAGFALVHGVALAGALRAAVPREEITAVLPAFLSGAELTQAAVIVGLALLTRPLAPAGGDRLRRVRLALSAALALAALALAARGL